MLDVSINLLLKDIRSITPKNFSVHVHIMGPSPHSVSLCCRVSRCPHDEQAVVSLRLMLASLSFVGITSCNTRIDPETVRLVAQRLNHYATPGPKILHVELHNYYLISSHSTLNALNLELG
jgi:hypothetical protein